MCGHSLLTIFALVKVGLGLVDVSTTHRGVAWTAYVICPALEQLHGMHSLWKGEICILLQ